MSSGEERRGQKRAQVELDIDLSTYEKYYLSKLVNLSVGGAFIRTRELQPVGTELKLRFQLPDQSKAIETKASVMWVYTQAGKREPNSSGIGVQFLEISDEDRSRIADFIELHKSR